MGILDDIVLKLISVFLLNRFFSVSGLYYCIYYRFNAWTRIILSKVSENSRQSLRCFVIAAFRGELLRKVPVFLLITINLITDQVPFCEYCFIM